jgi:P2 family phage contractile tail tube protein
MAQIPRVLKNFNMFADGRGYAGKVAELTLPKLTKKMEEFRGGGMNAPVEIDMGMEKLESEFTLKEYSEDVLLLWGVIDNAGVSLEFKGALQSDDIDGSVTAVRVVMRGRWKEIDGGTWKAGEDTSMKVSVAISYFRYESNGVPLIEIDVPNMIEMVGDVDRLSAIRQAIGA